MMDLVERIVWLSVGCGIGFILGYIVRSLQEIKEELDEVDQIVKQDHEDHNVDLEPGSSDDSINKRNEGGFTTNTTLYRIALGLVVLLTAWAAFASQKASNDVKDAQDDLTTTQQQLAETQARLARVTICNKDYLSKTIASLNANSLYTRKQANTNVLLQRAQKQFLSVFFNIPPAKDAERADSLHNYFLALSKFVEKSNEAQHKAKKIAPPTNADLEECLKVPPPKVEIEGDKND